MFCFCFGGRSNYTCLLFIFLYSFEHDHFFKFLHWIFIWKSLFSSRFLRTFGTYGGAKFSKFSTGHFHKPEPLPQRSRKIYHFHQLLINSHCFWPAQSSQSRKCLQCQFPGHRKLKRNYQVTMKKTELKSMWNTLRITKSYWSQN